METLYELCVVILSGGLGLVLFRLLKPKSVAKENQAVIVKIEDKQKENDKLAAEISSILGNAKKEMEKIEAEKNKDVTPKEVDDFFNNRKH